MNFHLMGIPIHVNNEIEDGKVVPFIRDPVTQIERPVLNDIEFAFRVRAQRQPMTRLEMNERTLASLNKMSAEALQR